MDQSLCKLTLVYPPESEDSLLEFMLEQDPPLSGFTTIKCEGHGLGFTRASASEKVRGRINRRLFIVIMDTQRVEPLLAQIKAELPISGLMFWTEPVSIAGRLL
ncbi:MAG: DUF3240 family protein [Robiginitomaculum sp.]|nr:DUF3240 family protein [Robiginitomaculum sp.]